MRILITGAHGQLGKALAKHYPDAIAVDRDELDITDESALAAFNWTDTDVIINAAAYTNVDGAETDAGRVAAWQINARAVANLAKIATQNGLTLVHISSDYVFDGSSAPHKETEPFSPLSVYGATKAAGDIAAGTSPKHYIVRASWLIGEGNNFVRTMMNLAQRNISPSVVCDQIGRLTFTLQLVASVDHLLTSRAEFGTYNLSGSGAPASWADITRAIFASLNRTDLTVTDVTTEQYYEGKTDIAARPLLSTLGLDKIKAAGFTPADWRDLLTEYIKNN